MTRVVRAAIVIACVELASVCLSAQDRGQLRVRVVDQTGGNLPEAKLVLQRDDQLLALVPTEVPGVFTIRDVPIGKYTLIVAAEGFAAATKPIDIRASRLIDVSVTLVVHADERVEVASQKIGVPNSLTSLTLSGKDLNLLPSDELQMLYRLQELAGSRGRPGDFALYVDGFSDFRRLPPKSAIDLIQINAEPYSAQFPEPGTRRIEIITKPGADQMYAEVKSDFNDDSLNARDPLATSKPDLQRRSLSGYFSGPIVRQRWGFYAYAGGWQQDENAIVNATVLNDALQPELFRQTLAAPERTANVTFNTTVAISAGSRIKAEYSRDTLTAHNQGLQSGFDLPERGYSSTNVTDAGRFSLLSVPGSNAVFELHAQVKSQPAQLRAQSGKTAIVVLDAFSAGANQSALSRDANNDAIQLDMKLTKAVGSHTLKAGGQLDRLQLSQVDYANFGGTFTFGADVERNAAGAPILTPAGSTIPISPLDAYQRTLLEVPGYKPTLFTITVGDPAANVTQWQGAGYLQDDWRRGDRLTISSGLRYETQTNLNDRLDFAPRVGAAWSLGERAGVIRAGVGAFYKRFDPALTLDVIRFDGMRQQQYTIQSPSFSPPPDLDEASSDRSIITKAADLKTGRLLMSTVSYERTLFGPLFGSATYTWERGDRLTRSTDINAPFAAGSSRPLDAGPILQYTSIGRSRLEELQLALQASLKSGSRLFLNYTYGSARSDTDDPQSLPADSHDLASEWGYAATDERHRIFLSGSVLLPHYWVVVPAFTYTTARPFNITSGLDTNLDGHVTDRPSYANPGDPLAIATPFGLLNPVPLPGETLIPRNLGRGARMMKFDLSVVKVFVFGSPLRSTHTLGVHVDATNLFNTANLKAYNGVLLSPLFGLPNTADPARRVSIGLALTF